MKNKFFCAFLLFALSCPVCFSYEVSISSIEEALSFALLNQKSLALQKENAALALRGARLSFDSFLPNLSFSLSGNQSREESIIDSENYYVQLGVEQPLFNGGKSLFMLRRSIHEAEQNMRLFEQKYAEYRLSVIKQFVRCVVLKKQCELEEAFLEKAREELSLVKAEWERGFSLEDDYLSCRISVMKIESEFASIKNQAQSAFRSFKMLCSVSDEVDISFENEDDWDDYAFLMEQYFMPIWNLLCKKNISLNYAASECEWQKKSLSLSALFFLPQVSVNASCSFSGRGFPLRQPDYSLGVNVSFSDIPLAKINSSANAGGNGTSLSKASAGAGTSSTFSPSYAVQRKMEALSLEQKMASVDEQRQSLKEQLRELLQGHDECVRSIEISEESVSLMKRKLELDRLKVSNGTMSRLEYLDDFMECVSKENELVSQKGECALSFYELDVLTGSGFGEVLNAFAK